MSLVGTIAGLTALAVYQGLFNGFLVALVVVMVLDPERAEKLRRWIGKLR